MSLPSPPESASERLASYTEIKRRIWSNTISNYICICIRLVTGIIMFRLLWKHLPAAEMGFWVILWSVFGFGVLLDFGFGFTAQKRVAELSVHQKWTELSQVLSTIFYTYVLIGSLIIVAGVLGSGYFIDLFEGVTPDNREKFRQVLVYFFIGLGLAFPLGIFPEMLRGLQRIAQANYILLGGMMINFAVAAYLLYNGYGIKALVVTALICTYLPDAVCGLVAKWHLPHVKISPRFFSRSIISETVSFSLFAYVITVSNVILTKTDQMVIGTFVGLAAVKIYAAGSKVAEMFFAFTQQLPDSLSPVAAHHHARQDKAMLRELLVDGTRFTLVITTPLYVLSAVFMDLGLQLLTDEDRIPGEIYWVAQVLLLWIYNLVITQSVSKRVFVMSGHERKLMWLSVAEAALNLGLSVALIIIFRDVWCVAVASLIAGAFMGWTYLWPWAAREANLSGWKLAKTVLFPTWWGCAPLLAYYLILQLIPPLSDSPGLTIRLFEAAIGGVIAVGGIWGMSLSAEDRERFSRALFRRLPRKEGS